MKQMIIQSIQILSLIFVMIYDAEAQTLKNYDSANLSKVDCSLVAAGDFNGNYFNIRIQGDQKVFAGGNSLEEAIVLLEDLQAHQMCKIAVHRCELTSLGMISSGQYMKHRLVINGEALFGTNDLGSLHLQLNRLRLQNICD